MLPSLFVTLLNDFTRQPQETAGPQAGLHEKHFPSDPRPFPLSFVAGTGQEKTGRYEAGFCSSLPTDPQYGMMFFNPLLDYSIFPLILVEFFQLAVIPQDFNVI